MNNNILHTLHTIKDSNFWNLDVQQNDDDFWNHLYVQQIIKNKIGNLLKGEDILFFSKFILISGMAGSGKTTLCHFLYKRLKGKENIYPCLINARDFNNIEKSDFQEYFNNQFLLKNQKNNKFYIIIDGLDEINPIYFQEITSNISMFFSKNEKYRAIITTRQTALTLVDFNCFSDFERYELQPLSQENVRQFINVYLKKSPFNVITDLEDNKLLRTIKTNPLLLTLALRFFQSYGTLPNSTYYTIELAIEQLLSTWDKSKNIFIRSKNSLGVNIKTLSLLSYYLEVNGKIVFELSDFQNVYNSRDCEDVFLYFSQSGLFIQETLDTYSFAHKTIQEYFLVKFFQDSFEINQKSKILLQYKPHVFELFVESENITAISNYVFHTDIEHSNIIYKLVNLYNHRNVIDNVQDLSMDNEKNGDDLIKKEWNDLLMQDDITIKGTQLEFFIGNFLSTQFEVVDKNFHTHNGEIDLVIENKLKDPFWDEFHTDYFIECKNWNKKAPIKEIQAFSQKVENSGIRLGFFVSLSGFTKDAIRAFENIASSASTSIIVPITFDDISKYLSTSEQNLNSFLKKLVRNIKYKKKY